MISVIIPVYNCEKYIIKCLESVLNSIYKDYEIIIVDDGSTDSTMDKIRCYRNKNIKIYHQHRQGPGAARNYGIEKASGDYIFFLDADDTINRTTFQLLVYNIGNSDMIIGNYKIIYDGGGVEEFITPLDHKFNTFFESVTIWNRLYKKEFIENNKIRFQHIYQGEDRLFLADIYLKHPKVKVIREFVYNWIRNENDNMQSLTHIKDASNFNGQLDCMIKFKKKLYNNLNIQEQKLLLDHLRYSCIYLTKILNSCHNNKCNIKKFNNFVNSIGFENNKKLYKYIFKKDWSEER